MADTIADLERKLAEREWIPVSERLPVDLDEVVVTVKNYDGEGFVDVVTFCEGHKTSQHKFIPFREYMRVYGIEDVVAWQPLPEPYVEGEKE